MSLSWTKVTEIVLTDELVSCAARFWDVTQWAAEEPKDERAGRHFHGKRIPTVIPRGRGVLP